MFRRLIKPLLASAIILAVIVPLRAVSQENRKPLTEAEIIDLLKNGVSSERVETLARQYGISFQMNDQAESALLVAGATDALLAALREVAPKPPAEPPTLIIEATPGGAQVFLDDELYAKTSPEGRLKVVTLKPGPHRVRIALDGYKDFEQVYTLEDGKTATAATALQAAIKTPENPRAGMAKGGAATPAVSSPTTNARPLRVIIPAGTIITVRLVADVDSSRDRPGTEFAAKIDAPVSVSGQLVIPQDADAHVRLMGVGTPAAPTLQIQLLSVTLKGRNFGAPADIYSKSAEPPKPASGSTRTGSVGGAVLGAIIGGAAGRAIAGNSRRTNTTQVKGPPQTLPKETKIDFTLRGPMYVVE